MQNNALLKASELTPPIRAAFESVLGQNLQDKETLSVNAYQPRPAPTGQARVAAYQRLIEHSDQIAQRVKDVPEEEIEATFEEAVDVCATTPNDPGAKERR
ncbi:MAG: hypothetical protein JO182_12515 [Acidobacteriaceae bacterium]|nr:hypothetical protein [Acidobacteriaceae bacterium]